MGIELVLLCIAVGASTLICVRATPIGRWLGVLDHPDNLRKRHKRVTPQIGGVAVLSGLMFWLAAAYVLGLIPDTGFANVVMLCGAGVALIGFIDDQNGISPAARLAFLVVFIQVAFALDHDMIVPRINSLIFAQIYLPLGAYCALVVVASLGVVNAVNMADGQDGVAAGMFVIWTACLAYLTTGSSRSIAIVLHMLCLVFLVFNLKPRGKVFLGDCGSYGITFVIGMLVILAQARGEVPIETVIVWFFIPVVDCLRLLVERARQGLSPFQADLDHFHHRLEHRLGKHRGLASYLAAVGCTSIISTLAPHWAPVCLCVLSGFYFGLATKRSTDFTVQVAERGLRQDNVVAINSDRNRGAA